MKIPASSLEAFLAVARQGRFASAAKSLGLSQSALSQRILNLEELLEATLFVRDRAGSRLTAEGEALVRHAQTLEGLEEEFLSGGLRGGVLRVAGFSSVTRSLVLPALAGLSREARLSVFARELGDLGDILRRGEADLVLLDREPDREGVTGVLLGYEENVPVRSRRAGATDVFLDHDADDTLTHRYFQKFGGGPRVLERRFLDDIYGILDGIRLGLGSAIVPLHLVRGDRDLQVVEPKRALRTPVWLHYPTQAFYPALHVGARDALVKKAKLILRREN